MANSPYFDYFEKMASAEKDLYKYIKLYKHIHLLDSLSVCIIMCIVLMRTACLSLYFNYSAWRKMTLNSDTEQSRYLVWDYPVKEQYTHILKVLYYILFLYRERICIEIETRVGFYAQCVIHNTKYICRPYRIQEW